MEKNNPLNKVLDNPVPILIIVGAVLAYKDILKPLIDKLMDPLGKGEQHKDDAKNIEQLKNENYFDSVYYKDLIGNNVIRSLTTYGKELYSKTIWNAKGIPYLTNDDEAAVYGVFRDLSAKTQISQLSEYFFAKYNKDLKTFLQSFLSKNEFGNVATICSKLPIGIVDMNNNIVK
jgi:hypothetical protein